MRVSTSPFCGVWKCYLLSSQVELFFKLGRKQSSCLEIGMENISHALMFIVSKVIDLSLVFSSAAASHCYAIKLIGMSQNIYFPCNESAFSCCCQS